MRISDWSSDVCSSDLREIRRMQMRIGVPSETTTLEGRVALVPAAAGDLVKRGHEVWLQKDAGVKSGFRDEAYTALGVKSAPDAAGLYEQAELLAKVKDPTAGDRPHTRQTREQRP